MKIFIFKEISPWDIIIISITAEIHQKFLVLILILGLSWVLILGFLGLDSTFQDT